MLRFPPLRQAAKRYEQAVNKIAYKIRINKTKDLKYFIGAYYLIKLRKLDYGKIKGSKVFTCSNCINDSYLDSWSISWSEVSNDLLSDTKLNFNITDKEIAEIQNWSDKKFDDKKIGWVNTFSDLKTLVEYKSLFFPNETDFQVLSINFSENERDEFLKVFSYKTNHGEIGISINLENQLPENDNENFLGYDLIGVEDSGDFHSFHCHDLAEDLIQKFNVEINKFGLLENHDNWNEIVAYMNDESNGFETTPWFLVKVKRVNQSASS